MSIKFNIQETVETELFYGAYCIYILGGHQVKVNSNFCIKIVNLETKENIQLFENSLKPRDFKFGKKAVKFYTCQINEYSKFKISVYHYEDIIVKDSILEAFPFSFNLPNIIKSFITGRSTEIKKLNTIEILLE